MKTRMTERGEWQTELSREITSTEIQRHQSFVAVYLLLSANSENVDVGKAKETHHWKPNNNIWIERAARTLWRPKELWVFYNSCFDSAVAFIFTQMDFVVVAFGFSCVVVAHLANTHTHSLKPRSDYPLSANNNLCKRVWDVFNSVERLFFLLPSPFSSFFLSFYILFESMFALKHRN